MKRLLVNSIYARSFKGLSKEIWLLSLVMLINRSGAMVIPFLTIYLNTELNLALNKCAFIMVSFGLGSVVGSFTGGVLTDRIGFFKVMYSSLLLSSICFMSMMNVTTFLPLCMGIFILACIYEVFRPANLTAIETFSKKENKTRSLGLVRLAVNLGYAIGPFAGGMIAASLGFDYLFLFNGLALLIGGITFFILFKNKKQRATEKEISAMERKALQMPWKDKKYLIYLFFFTLTIFVFLQLLYTAPLFFKTVYGFSEKMIGSIMALNGIIIVIFEMPLLYKIENSYKPVLLVVIGSVLIGLGFGVFTLISVPMVAAVIYTLFVTFGEMLSFPFSNSHALNFTNDHNRGKYMGLYTMTFSSAHVVAPLAGLYLVEWAGYGVLWGGSAIVCIMAAGMIWWTGR